MIEIGRVSRIGERDVDIVFTRSGACERCGRCGMAGDRREAVITIGAPAYPWDVSVGDRVSVELPEGRVLGASLLAYGVPLAALVLGAGLGPAVARWAGFAGTADIAAAIGALCFTAMAFIGLRLADRPLNAGKAFAPRIVGTVGGDAPLDGYSGADFQHPEAPRSSEDVRQDPKTP